MVAFKMFLFNFNYTIMEKIFSNLYSDLINQDNKFIFKSKSHSIIIFCILSIHKITFEELCQKIPHKIISRSSIQRILNEGVELNFLEKKIDEKDKRSKSYSVSKKNFTILKNWAEEKKELFNSIAIN
tara:strand:+ start:330 stop:713 length:384 start_codon:yes stop_codon:yes gene_type:complete